MLTHMNSTLVSYGARAECEGLAQTHLSLATELREMVGTFTNLTQDANLKTEAVIKEAESMKRDYEGGASSKHDKKPAKKRRKLDPKPKVDEEVEDTFMTPSVLGSIEEPPVSMLGYQMFWENAEPDATMSQVGSSQEQNEIYDVLCQYNTASPDTSWHWETSSEGQTSQTSLTSIGAMSPKVLSALTPPLSYACKESTFARRLHRATLEKALHLIGDQILKPEVFKKKFQLCLPYGDSEQIYTKVNSTLLRDPKESLEWLDHPLAHLGGAGTHYIKISNAASQSQTTLRVKSIGAQTLATLMSVTSEDHTQGRCLDITGFEGEWFDPEDVQAYLAERGIIFDPKAVIAELELPDAPCKLSSKKRRQSLQEAADVLDFLPLSVSNEHPPSTDAIQEPLDALTPPTQNSNLNGWNFPGTATLLGTDDTDSSASAVLESLSSRDFKEPRTLTINVDTFVKGMCE